ncbi:MAG: tetratricopeptide repeat protein, partial [bacterium]|nr:tetratricopeptide repeat protein [bacterium]
MKLFIILIFFYLEVLHANPILCDVSQGLDLINRSRYSPAQIEMILNSCDKVSPNNPDVLLLHGLVARNNKQYPLAIEWFAKAKAEAPKKLAILLELATTFELAHQPEKAKQLYEFILLQNPHNRPALYGLARIFRIEGAYNQAATIYQDFLVKDSRDVDALNGLGWVYAAQNKFAVANRFFTNSLEIQPQNEEALDALDKMKRTQVQQQGFSPTCEANKGLLLLNQNLPPIMEIKTILKHCSTNKIDNKETQLLQGLLARHEAAHSKHYDRAINWLQKAVKSAPNDYNLALELAITYEWAGQVKNAELLYQKIIAHEPTNRGALLGQARVFRLLKNITAARTIYQQLMGGNAKDVDALNGLGWIALEQKNRQSAIQF